MSDAQRFVDPMFRLGYLEELTTSTLADLDCAIAGLKGDRADRLVAKVVIEHRADLIRKALAKIKEADAS